MFYGNITQLGKKSNSVIRSRSVKCKNWCNVSSMESGTGYDYTPEWSVTLGRGGPFDYTAVAGSAKVGP